VGRAVTFAMQRRGKHVSTTIEGLFSVSFVPKSYLEDNWRYSSVVGFSPDSNDVSTEAEESLTLDAARKQD
jgi:hypothetical protein